jgi:hypothetical protein
MLTRQREKGKRKRGIEVGKRKEIEFYFSIP